MARAVRNTEKPHSPLPNDLDNLYELLGNDSDQDSDKEPAPPLEVADKPVARHGKRDAPATAPSEARGRAAGGERGGRAGRSRGRGAFSGNDGALRDREAGSMNNRDKPINDGLRQDRHPNRIEGGRDRDSYDGRGGRGGRAGRGGRGNRDDRHTRGLPNDHVKQTDQSWGAPTGDSEWKDEQAGEAIAKAEEKNESTAGGWNASAATGNGWDSSMAAVSTDAAPTGDADGAAPAEGSSTANAPAEPVAEPEPEDNSRSYADYLTEQAEKKLKLGSGVPEARKPNEGSKDKKYANAKPVAKEGGEDFFSGKSEKAKRERQRKEKNILDIDIKYVETQSGRGGGDRGGRGRGRGDRGDFRGRGRGRGDGFRGRSDSGLRGGRGMGDGGSVNVKDENAFPSLGGSKPRSLIGSGIEEGSTDQEHSR
ncbi:MAG: hypothetical protein Q9175_002960 [Cornicularia normoerica]